MNSIQWFPGHMAKAQREAQENVKLADVVLELVDARIPESSQNPIIQDIIADKKFIMVLNKADLADPQETDRWISYYLKHGIPAISIDAQHNKGIRQLQNKIKEMMAPDFKALKAKGVKPRPIRLMTLGVSNVGKSTLINRFVKKNTAKVGDQPGVTRNQRWLKIGKDFELLDTPGILWPKYDDQTVAKKLALTGAIKDTLLHMDDIALLALDYLVDEQPDQLIKRYRVTNQEIENLSRPDLLLRITELMGLRDNYDEASQRIVRDLRSGQLGRISFDKVNDLENEE